jgi:hypothetical protein
VANPLGRALVFLFLTEQEGCHTCADLSTNLNLSYYGFTCFITALKQYKEEKSEHQHKQLDQMLHLHEKQCPPTAAASVYRHACLARYSK